MRILLVTAMVAGGVGRHVRQLARGLVRRGHEVTVACPAAVVEQFCLAETGATVVPLPVGTRGGVLLGDDRLTALIAEADVVHAHGMRAAAAAARARRGDTPLVVTTHNAPPRGRLGLVYDGLERYVCHHADVVLGVSPDLVARAQARQSRGIDLAVVPADRSEPMTEERRSAARADLRTELGLPVDALDPQVIFSAGRFSDQKRMEALVDAYEELLRIPVLDDEGNHVETPDPVLVIAGDGPDEDALRRRAEATPGDIRLLGFRHDVPELLCGADVVVSSSRWEGQPLILQEALAAGVPVVATDVGGTGVVLGNAGLLVSGDDDLVVDELATTMARVLDEPDLADRLSDLSLERAAELPSEEDAVDAALHVYQRAVLR